MALAAATLSNNGQQPAPRLVMSVDTPQAGWVMLPSSAEAQQRFESLTVNNLTEALQDNELPVWQVVAAQNNDTNTANDANSAAAGFSWYLGGTTQEWSGAPLAMAVLLEENNPSLAKDIGSTIFQLALYP